MRIIRKRIISIIVIALMLLSSLMISAFAAEEDIQSVASASTASYKYSTFINKIYYNYGTFDSDLIITSPFSSSSCDAPYQVDCHSVLLGGHETLSKLRVYGWFLTDGGVRKYAVKITQGDKTLEYDVHNYQMEDQIQTGVENKAINDGLVDYKHNAIYDIDVYLDDFDLEGGGMTITLLAYSRYGEIFEVWNFINATVWDKVSLSATSTSYCRYCCAPVNNWVYSDPYSHRNCGIEYVCTCGKGNTFVMPLHSMTEIDSEGNAYCKTCGIRESFTMCNIDPLTVFRAPFDEDNHSCYYTCDIDTEGWGYAFDCGDVCILEPHNVANCTCVLCYAHVHEFNLHETIYCFEPTTCYIEYYRCFFCDEMKEVVVEHVSNGCVCIECGYMFSSHDYIKIPREYLYKSDCCYENKEACSNCDVVFFDGFVPHTFINGVCTECNYALAPEPEPEPDTDVTTPEEESVSSQKPNDEGLDGSTNKFTDFLDNVKSKAAPLIALFILVDVLIAGYVIWKWLKKLSKR